MKKLSDSLMQFLISLSVISPFQKKKPHKKQKNIKEQILSDSPPFFKTLHLDVSEF